MTLNQSTPAKKWLVRLLVVLAGLTAGVVGWTLWPDQCGGAFSGFRLNDQQNAECIGITDGSFRFNDPAAASSDADRVVMERINEIQARIVAENKSVASADRYVKVVLLMPLTVSRSKPSAVSLPQILHSVEGSYTGQMRANGTSAFGDPPVTKLQLLLANQGSQQESGPDFIDDIVAESEPDHPVVAVVGLGVSRPETKDAARELAGRGLPMVSAVTSADELTNLPNFWSVSPSSTDYVKALKSYLQDQSLLKSGIIVYDQNPDLYTRSLADAYRDQLGQYIKYPAQPFRGGTIDSPVAPTVFNPVVQNLCNAARRPADPLDVVFFAGRVVDFDEFALALENRICKDRPLAVLVGSAGFTAALDYQEILRRSNVTVIHASSSDAIAWDQNAPGTPPDYAEFVKAYRAYVPAAENSLADGYAIAHHDAFVTAARAIRLAASSRSTHVPDPHNVASNGFSLLNLDYEVPAASGKLSFPPEHGRATGRFVPLQQVNRDTSIQLPVDLEPYVVR